MQLITGLFSGGAIVLAVLYCYRVRVVAPRYRSSPRRKLCSSDLSPPPSPKAKRCWPVEE